MKPKLHILSDLFGFENSLWINKYVELLELDFHLIFYDSCKLAGIDSTNLSENELHSKFVNRGIDSAVKEFLKLENEEIDVLAFSIGGTIAWKAALNGLKINNLYVVSSTRLRYETEKPTCSIQAFFGEKDAFKPEDIWFKTLDLDVEIIRDGQHEIYKKEEVINTICNRIKHDYFH